MTKTIKDFEERFAENQPKRMLLKTIIESPEGLIAEGIAEEIKSIVGADEVLKKLYDSDKLYISSEYFKAGKELFEKKARESKSTKGKTTASKNPYSGDNFEEVLLATFRELPKFQPEGRLARAHNAAAIDALSESGGFKGISIELFPNLVDEGNKIGRFDFYDHATRLVEFCPRNLANSQGVNIPNRTLSAKTLLAHELAHAIDYNLNNLDSAVQLITTLADYAGEDVDGANEALAFASKAYTPIFAQQYELDQILHTDESLQTGKSLTPKAMLEEYKTGVLDSSGKFKFSAVVTEFLGFYAENISTNLDAKHQHQPPSLDIFKQKFSETLKRKVTNDKDASFEQRLFSLDVMEACSREYVKSVRNEVTSEVFKYAVAEVEQQRQDLSVKAEKYFSEEIEKKSTSLKSLNGDESSTQQQELSGSIENLRQEQQRFARQYLKSSVSSSSSHNSSNNTMDSSHRTPQVPQTSYSPSPINTPLAQMQVGTDIPLQIDIPQNLLGLIAGAAPFIRRNMVVLIDNTEIPEHLAPGQTPVHTNQSASWTQKKNKKTK